MKKLIQNIALLLFLLCTFSVYAQSDCKVQGVVVDVSGETVPYATVGAYQGKKNITRLQLSYVYVNKKTYLCKFIITHWWL